jgi:hypothetical protein
MSGGESFGKGFLIGCVRGGAIKGIFKKMEFAIY